MRREGTSVSLILFYENLSISESVGIKNLGERTKEAKSILKFLLIIIQQDPCYVPKLLSMLWNYY